ncbi:DUF3035 domain-containing protein, partial [Candidatus Pelagibacter sp.]|nr:DUF3035 domain-containing protein [Candidatus Pelagibacter sp.]
MNKKSFSFLISILIFTILTGCQDVKKGLSGKKINEGNEFLVIKKNPLVVPPNFNELPQPSDNNIENNSNKDNENEFKNIMKKNEDNILEND